MQHFYDNCESERQEEQEIPESFESPEWHTPHYPRRCHNKYEPDYIAKYCKNIYIYPPETMTVPEVKPVKFAQLMDMNLNVTMTEQGNIQLVSAPDQLMERGGFSLISSEAPNDTLVLPAVGVYKLDINMKYSFLPKEDTPINTFYQVIVESILGGRYLPSLSIDAGVVSPNTNSGILSTSLMINVLKKNEELKLVLDNFAYEIAYKSMINFHDILVGLVRISTTPVG